MRLIVYTVIIIITFLASTYTQQIEWEFSYDNTYQDIGLGIRKIDSDYLIFGITQPSQYGQNHGLLIKITNTGDSLWTTIYNNSIYENFPLNDFYITSDTTAVSFGTSHSDSTYNDLQISLFGLPPVS